MRTEIDRLPELGTSAFARIQTRHDTGHPQSVPRPARAETSSMHASTDALADPHLAERPAPATNSRAEQQPPDMLPWRPALLRARPLRRSETATPLARYTAPRRAFDQAAVQESLARRRSSLVERYRTHSDDPKRPLRGPDVNRNPPQPPSMRATERRLSKDCVTTRETSRTPTSQRNMLPEGEFPPTGSQELRPFRRPRTRYTDAFATHLACPTLQPGDIPAS